MLNKIIPNNNYLKISIIQEIRLECKCPICSKELNTSFQINVNDTEENIKQSIEKITNWKFQKTNKSIYDTTKEEHFCCSHECSEIINNCRTY